MLLSCGALAPPSRPSLNNAPPDVAALLPEKTRLRRTGLHVRPSLLALQRMPPPAELLGPPVMVKPSISVSRPIDPYGVAASSVTTVWLLVPTIAVLSGSIPVIASTRSLLSISPDNTVRYL